jgi:hypothetical protein
MTGRRVDRSSDHRIDDRGLSPGGSAAEGRRGLIDRAARHGVAARRLLLAARARADHKHREDHQLSSSHRLSTYHPPARSSTLVQTEGCPAQARAMAATPVPSPIALAEIPGDIAYVQMNYITLDALARGLGEVDWPGARMPRATYRLADGSHWYARDWWRLHDEAGGVAELPTAFARRLLAASEAHDHPCDAAQEWDAYLAGLYGACLHEVTPEAIVRKEWLVARLDRALGDPRPDDPSWLASLRGDVDALDALSRPFAVCDRERFGRPTSRDRLIDGARRSFPRAFATP